MRIRKDVALYDCLDFNSYLPFPGLFTRMICILNNEDEYIEDGSNKQNDKTEQVYPIITERKRKRRLRFG